MSGGFFLMGAFTAGLRGGRMRRIFATGTLLSVFLVPFRTQGALPKPAAETYRSDNVDLRILPVFSLVAQRREMRPYLNGVLPVQVAIRNFTATPIEIHSQSIRLIDAEGQQCLRLSTPEAAARCSYRMPGPGSWVWAGPLISAGKTARRARANRAHADAFATRALEDDLLEVSRFTEGLVFFEIPRSRRPPVLEGWQVEMTIAAPARGQLETYTATIGAGIQMAALAGDAQAPSSRPATDKPGDVIAAIRGLGELRDEGLITEEEFVLKKNELMQGLKASNP